MIPPADLNYVHNLHLKFFGFYSYYLLQPAHLAPILLKLHCCVPGHYPVLSGLLTIIWYVQIHVLMRATIIIHCVPL